jgi:hypothetical protein
MARDVREQRLVFGEDAELYEKARAGYPESLVDDALAVSDNPDIWRPPPRGSADDSAVGDGRLTDGVPGPAPDCDFLNRHPAQIGLGPMDRHVDRVRGQGS